VEVDEGQISQVIHNLTINSTRPAPDGGIIKVSAGNAELGANNEPRLKRADTWNITIEDTGIGMTKELMDKIFDPYFTTKQRGSGLDWLPYIRSSETTRSHRGFIKNRGRARGSISHSGRNG
jgi:signal transduction histidine kinase